MSGLKTGGPAFPPMHDPHNHPSGMSLRDYFAAKAMQAVLTDSSLPGFVQGDPEAVAAVDELATGAYMIANAMLKARQP